MESTSDIIERMQKENSKTKSKGFTMINNTFIQSNFYSVQEKMLYMILKSYSFKTNIVWPSIKRMTSDAQLSKTTVIKVLKQLREKGAIQRAEGSHRSQSYKLNIGPHQGSFHNANRFMK